MLLVQMMGRVSERCMLDRQYERGGCLWRRYRRMEDDVHRCSTSSTAPRDRRLSELLILPAARFSHSSIDALQTQVEANYATTVHASNSIFVWFPRQGQRDDFQTPVHSSL